MKALAVIGESYGKLTIVEDTPTGARYRTVVVRCSCGSPTKVVRLAHLRSGYAKSCGCAQHALKHGEARQGGRTTEYSCWAGMIQRCLNPRATKFERYGGRGIKVCDRWLNSYENFLADMGRKPSATHSIDRIEVNGDYEPDNCKWSTHSEQNRNRRPFSRGTRANMSAAQTLRHQRERRLAAA